MNMVTITRNDMIIGRMSLDSAYSNNNIPDDPLAKIGFLKSVGIRESVRYVSNEERSTIGKHRTPGEKLRDMERCYIHKYSEGSL